jgi:DNA invertase Pin-like site-specific DNA recombinase
MSKRVKAGSPRIGIGYLRGSKREQELTLEGQRTAIERWALRENVTIAGWFTDAGVCSVDALEERPTLMAALAALRDRGAGLLVVAKRDRLSRDPYITMTVEREAQRLGARVVASDGNNGTDATAQLTRTILDGVAAHELAMIRSRTRSALAVKRARGEKTGGSVPFGYSLDSDGRTLVPVALEQATIVRARELSAEGGSLRAVAAVLAAEGHVSRKGGVFLAPQVSRMLASTEGQSTAA